MKRFCSFTIENIHKIYEGRKWQTRRLKKPNFLEGDVCVLPEPLVNINGVASYALDPGYSVINGDGVMAWRWKVNRLSARYMPTAAGRSAVRVKRIWQEPLCDISSYHCRAEGCSSQWPETVEEVFERLWNSIHPETPFADNPDVWVMEFSFMYDWIRGGGGESR